MRTTATILPLLFVLAASACTATDGDPAVIDEPPPADPEQPVMPGEGPITTPDPAADGPRVVVQTTASIPGAASGRTLSATVFAPADGAGRPLVVISPGFQMARAQYASYARHLATWGLVAVLTDYAEGGFFIDHTRLANDVPAVITWALAQPSLAIDPDKVAVAGHSLGGKISVYAASLDRRIRAIVGWDPVDSTSPSVAPEKMGALHAAIALIGETTNAAGGGMPCAPAAENFQQFFAAAPSPAIAITVKGADHMDWVDNSSCATCGFCAAGTAPADLARKVTRRASVAWLRRQLLGDLAMDPWLHSPPELGDGTVAIARR